MYACKYVRMYAYFMYTLMSRVLVRLGLNTLIGCMYDVNMMLECMYVCMHACMYIYVQYV